MIEHYSNYHLSLRAGTENLSFEEAIKIELNNLNNIEINLENNLQKYTIPRSYIAKGFYAEQLKIWQKLFKSDQLLILSTEKFEDNFQETINKIFTFLKIPKYTINKEKHKVASYPKMKPDTRKCLINFYKSHNEELFKMIGQEFDWNN